MNKIKFDASILNLHSYDYEYLQSQIENELFKLYKALIGDPDAHGVIRGFTASISESDSTTINVTHNGLGGYVFFKAGYLIEDVSGISGLELSDYTNGVVNYIGVELSHADASYDKSTETIVVGEQKAIDISNYSLQYDRLIDTIEIVVYTRAEYIALSTSAKEAIVLLGSVIAQGSGQPLLSITTVIRETVQLYIPDKSVEYAALSDSFILPQDQIYETETVDDTFFGTPQSLVDDLNKIRTVLRYIRGTTSWDEELGSQNLLAFDYAPQSLHSSGVFSEYGDSFSYEITSSGYAIQINSGKALINGQVVQILASDPKILDVSPGDVAKFSKTAYFEVNQPDTVQISTTPIDYVEVWNEGRTRKYLEGKDYTVSKSTGEIISVWSGDISDRTVNVDYTSGQFKYCFIGITADGDFEYLDTDSELFDSDVYNYFKLILYSIYRHPIYETISASEIKDSRIYTKTVEDIRYYPVTSTGGSGYLPKYYFYDSVDWTYKTTSGVTCTPYLETADDSVYLAFTFYAYTGENLYGTFLHSTSSGEVWIRPYEVGAFSDVTVETGITAPIAGSYYRADKTTLIYSNLAEGYYTLFAGLSPGESGKACKIHGFAVGNIKDYKSLITGNDIAPGSIGVENISDVGVSQTITITGKDDTIHSLVFTNGILTAYTTS